MSNSSASSATITAVAVFKNGRFCEGQGRALIFDAQMYLGDDQPPLLAALKCFNAENHVFDPVGFYIVIARLIPIVKDGVSPLYMPYIELCGTVKSTDDLTSGTSRPNQVFKSAMPVECAFPNTSPDSSLEERSNLLQAWDQSKQRFTVEVDSIVFLGRPVVTKSLGNIASHGPSPSRMPSKPGMKFDFSQVAQPAKHQRTEENIN
ncbi:uncharacterized protein BJ212DRAFT_1475124 [Suillus subaureus]|uniref:Uncharacterized protein n=1 Tax=Suillus subaureus TaxID=48587 RepID=A0A9P7ELS6_9AGAM|nr:uncharacterized protein BJ212DRAFT_1475124 [Suillus subaureus]KAG1825741.1 hypothetical protein BJ212DRAFT_1475124 [Suillus subaureus]